MQLCPNCGANIGGLVAWCDCCGLPFTAPEYITLFEHDYAGSGDIGKYLTDTVADLNSLGLEQISPYFTGIELVTYCYPIQLVQELKLTNRIRLSKKNGRATLTIVFHYERYTNLSASEKVAYVKDTLNSAIISLFQKKQPEYVSEVKQRLNVL